MATTKHVECNNCSAVFKISHDMDPDYYKVEACPFCSEPIDEEQDFDVKNDDE